MRSLYVIVLFFVVQLSNSQEVRLRILGSSAYSEIAEKEVLLLHFENNPEVCNPLTQNKLIEVQVDEFIAALKLDGIDFQLLHKETLSIDPERSKTYELLVSLDANIYKIKKLINAKGVKLVKTYYKFSEDALVSQDKKAILAYQNSERRAKEIAKALGYTTLKVVNIDDDTSDAINVMELLGIDEADEEKKERMLSFFEGLNTIERNTDATKDGTYNLWVTYAIKL